MIRLPAKRFIFYHAAFFAALCFLSSACYQPTTGCLEAGATNFDVSVDKACDTCCAAPYLVLALNYKTGANNFAFDSVYNNDVAQKFKISKLSFYLSDFQLVDANNIVYTVSDTVKIYRQNDSLYVPNNFALVDKKLGFTFRLGHFKKNGLFKKLRFKIGLNDTLNKAIPSLNPSGSPLSTQTDSVYSYTENRYIFSKIEIEKGIFFNDTLQFNITAPIIQNEIVKDITFLGGFDATINLQINVTNIFMGIKLNASSKTDIQNGILKNLMNNQAGVFSVQ